MSDTVYSFVVLRHTVFVYVGDKLLGWVKVDEGTRYIVPHYQPGTTYLPLPEAVAYLENVHES